LYRWGISSSLHAKKKSGQGGGLLLWVLPSPGIILGRGRKADGENPSLSTWGKIRALRRKGTEKGGV